MISSGNPNSNNHEVFKITQSQQDTSRIQFFSSSSSILEQSTHDNQSIIFMQSEIYQETELIFLSLEKELSQAQINQNNDTIGLILNRAHILEHFTIPDYLSSQGSNVQNSNAILQCYQKVKELNQMYQLLKDQKIQFQTFCDAFRKRQDPKSFKKSNQTPLQNAASRIIHFNTIEHAQIVPIQQQSPNKNLYFLNQKYQTPQKISFNQFNKNTSMSQIKYSQNSSVSSHQQIYKLQSYNKLLVQKVYFLKKEIDEMKTIHSQKIEEQRKMYSQRIQKVIQLILSQWQRQHVLKSHQKVKSDEHTWTTLMKQLSQVNDNLAEQVSQNQLNRQKIATLKQKIQNLQQQNTILKSSLQRTQTILSSNYSSLEQEQYNDKQSRNSKRQNQNLLTEIKLLKGQIIKARQFYFLEIKSFKEKNQAGMNKIKDQLKKKKLQVVRLQLMLDEAQTKRCIIENQLKLNQQKLRAIRKNQSQASLLRPAQNKAIKQMNKTADSFYKSNQSLQLFAIQPKVKSQQPVPQPRIQRQNIKIQPYLSDVLEGFVYFKCLQKQHRYRYMRACLKQKQLLYKRQGIQIGVITKLNSDKNPIPQLQITLFLTNSSQTVLQNIKPSFIQSNNKNQLNALNLKQRYTIQPNQQIKINLNFSIKSYPIGSLIMRVHGLQNQIRLLLPVNIVKHFKFEICDVNAQDFHASDPKIVIIAQKKVYKNLQTLIEWLLNRKQCNSSDKIQLFAQHQPSQTKIKIFLFQNKEKDLLQITYFKQHGSTDITDYLMKNFKLLIEKEKN